MEEVELDYTGVAPGCAPVKIDDGARIARYGQSRSDIFAGQWIENETSRVVAFTESVEEHLEAIQRLVYAPEKIWAVQFRYTYRHLLDLNHQIVEILGTSDGLTDWGPDVIHNRVVVHVLPRRLERVREALAQRYPDEIGVEEGSPVRTLTL
jgi:hypothetical protein